MNIAILSGMLFFLALFSVQHGGCAEAEKVNTVNGFKNPVLYLLDAGKNTYLFRGKMPERDGRFCYEELACQFSDYLTQTGQQLSPDFDLLCISLLNCSEGKERKIESQWFSQNPNKGRLWMYPLFGSWVDPCHLSASFRKSVLACDPDGLQSLMLQMKWQMDSGHPEGRDMVIYIHCHAGKDRTGEAAACYLMQYKGYSYQQATALAKQVAGRKLRRVSVNAIRWHAFYLRDTLNFATIGHID
jgi:Dual specificity phosphatase, catalytic domain.